MAHFERSERGGRPPQWRRRQQRWSGMDQAHNDNRLAGFHYDACRTGHRPLQPTVQHDSHTVVLDELTFKHVAEDCSSVKSQLLKLKSLLQMDDGEITPESLDSSEDDSRTKQMEELMKEVAHLREEVKNKDKIIARLTHQQHQESPVRCHCHQLKSGAKGERRTHHDKSTQTPDGLAGHPELRLVCRGADLANLQLLRENGLYPLLSSLPGSASTRLHLVPACLNADKPQILQPISHIPNEPLIQGKLARTVPTGGHNDACTEGEQPSISCRPVPSTDPILPHVESKSLPDPEELSWLLSTHLRIHDNESDSQWAGEQIVRPTPESHQNKLLNLSFSPRVLQPPRLHKRVTLPALPIGGNSGSNPKPGPSMNHKPHQLLPPPPSRGLPCYSAGIVTVTRGRLSQPWPAVVRREPDPEHDASVPLGIKT